MTDIFEFLKWQAALCRLDQLSSEEMRSIIDECLNQGFYFDEFLEVIDAFPVHLSVIKPAFEKSLLKMGIPIPDESEAIRLIIQNYLCRILKNPKDPQPILAELMGIIYYNYHYSRDLLIRQGVWDLYCLCANYGSFIGGPYMQLGYDVNSMEKEFIESIILESEQWLKINGRGEVKF